MNHICLTVRSLRWRKQQRSDRGRFLVCGCHAYRVID